MINSFLSKERSNSLSSAILLLMFFRTQNSPRRWRRGRHPSQRWTRLIDSEPNKHMLRWNIFWWCFLLLGLQNLFTPIRYYCISCEEHLLKGMKLNVLVEVNEVEFSQTYPSFIWTLWCEALPWLVLEIRMLNLMSSSQCPRSYTAKSWWGGLGSGNPFQDVTVLYYRDPSTAWHTTPVHGINIQGRKNNLYLSLNPIQVQYISLLDGNKKLILYWFLSVSTCVCVCLLSLESKTQWNVNC